MPSPLDQRILASLVARPRPAVLDGACPAWTDDHESRCGRPATVGHLCATHHAKAQKLLEAKLQEIDRVARAKRRRNRATGTDRNRRVALLRAQVAAARNELAALDAPRPARSEHFGSVPPPRASRRRKLGARASAEHVRITARIARLRGELESLE